MAFKYLLRVSLTFWWQART